MLLGEAKWSWGLMSDQEIRGAFHELLRKGIPPLRGVDKTKTEYALFIPEVASSKVREPSLCLVDAETVLSSLM